MFDIFLSGFIVGLFVILIWGIVYGTMFAIWKLAQFDILNTTLYEGYTKQILKNNSPHRLVMRSMTRRFRIDDPNDDSGEHPYDIVNYNPSPPTLSKTQKKWASLKKILKIVSGVNLLDNLVWVGFPPVYSVYNYPFSWTSLEQRADEHGAVRKVLVVHTEILSYILAPQQKVYFAVIESAETSELIPIDASIALTIEIVNPFKALHEIDQWLNAVINQIEPAAREVIGRYTLKQLMESKESKSNELFGDKEFKKRLKKIKKDYGVDILIAQFRSIDPSPEVAPKIRELSTAQYTADRESERIRTLAKARSDEIRTIAEAEEERLNKEIGAVKKHGEKGVRIRQFELLPKNLQVLSIGGSDNMPILPTAIDLSKKTREKRDENNS